MASKVGGPAFYFIKSKSTLIPSPFGTLPSKLDFDGSFGALDGTYHISTVDNYRNSRRHGQDISIVSPLSRDTKHRNANMIIFKDVQGHHAHSAHLEPTVLSNHYGCGFTPGMARKDYAGGLTKRSLSKRQSQGSCFQSTKKVLQMVRDLY